ncbi:MAG TPA: hypothetical protein VFW92_12065, partial [Candidatus Limnocylindrales bacterium]|nr:hypothetical protein [Candidatus Limnocylindrales bacterium]
ASHRGNDVEGGPIVGRQRQMLVDPQSFVEGRLLRQESDIPQDPTMLGPRVGPKDRHRAIRRPLEA